jgi:hypothetical protein
VLLGHVPLQEVEGGVILGGEGDVGQTVDALGDVILVLQGGAEDVTQGLEFMGGASMAPSTGMAPVSLT